MEFVVTKGQFLRELQHAQGVVERKTTVPILSNLLLEATSERLNITATDLDVTLRCTCQGRVKQEGALAVSARKLLDIVRLLPEADIHVKRGEENWLHLICERSRFRIASLSKENFPELPSPQGEAVHLPAQAFRQMVTKSIFAITQEESRYALNGAQMILSAGSLTLVTTDGHRLVLISHDGDVSGVEGEKRVLVPKKALLELSKLISEDLSALEFRATENHLFFQVGERLLVSRILSGQFPNYEMVIPKDNHRRIVVDTLSFTEALRRVSVMADEQSRAVRFRFEPGEVQISSASADLGDARESLPVEYEGEPLEIGFNAGYLLDFLSVLDSEQLRILLRDADTQGLFEPESSAQQDYHYVVMPMSL